MDSSISISISISGGAGKQEVAASPRSHTASPPDRAETRAAFRDPPPLPGLKEGSEILPPVCHHPDRSPEIWAPRETEVVEGRGGRWEGGGGRRQRSSKREKENLKTATGNRGATTTVTASTTTASTDTAAAAAAAAALGAPRHRHGNSASVARTAALSVGHVVIRGIRQRVFYP
ncbi:hypothetical protein PAMP_001173 [Pampus punctatissimus]